MLTEDIYLECDIYHNISVLLLFLNFVPFFTISVYIVTFHTNRMVSVYVSKIIHVHNLTKQQATSLYSTCYPQMASNLTVLSSLYGFGGQANQQGVKAIVYVTVIHDRLTQLSMILTEPMLVTRPMIVSRPMRSWTQLLGYHTIT